MKIEILHAISQFNSVNCNFENQTMFTVDRTTIKSQVDTEKKRYSLHITRPIIFTCRFVPTTTHRRIKEIYTFGI